MNPFIMWTIIAIFFAIIELLNVSFFIINFSFGAVIALISSYFTKNISIQLSVFLISSVIFLIITRPIIKKLQKEDIIKTNVDGLIGKKGIVTEEIDNLKNVGQIKVNGEIWSATSENEKVLEKGTKVEIIKVTGVKTIVKKIN